MLFEQRQCTFQVVVIAVVKGERHRETVGIPAAGEQLAQGDHLEVPTEILQVQLEGVGGYEPGVVVQAAAAIDAVVDHDSPPGAVPM